MDGDHTFIVEGIPKAPMTSDEQLAGIIRTAEALIKVGGDLVTRTQAVRVAVANGETDHILCKDELERFKTEAAGREAAMQSDIEGLRAAVTALQGDKVVMQETINAQLAERETLRQTIENLLKLVNGEAGSVPPPAPPPPPPPPAPEPPPAPPPAPGEGVPPMPPEFRKRPTISGDAEVGAVLTRTMAEADPGWEAYQGRWYVLGSTDEIGGQGKQPTDMVPPGAKVVYREWFRNEAGRVIDVYSLPFGPFVQTPRLTGRIQIPAKQEQ